jgi:hypothetical protein
MEEDLLHDDDYSKLMKTKIDDLSVEIALFDSFILFAHA